MEYRAAVQCTAAGFRLNMGEHVGHRRLEHVRGYQTPTGESRERFGFRRVRDRQRVDRANCAGLSLYAAAAADTDIGRTNMLDVARNARLGAGYCAHRGGHLVQAGLAIGGMVGAAGIPEVVRRGTAVDVGSVAESAISSQSAFVKNLSNSQSSNLRYM